MLLSKILSKIPSRISTSAGSSPLRQWQGMALRAPLMNSSGQPLGSAWSSEWLSEVLGKAFGQGT